MQASLATILAAEAQGGLPVATSAPQLVLSDDDFELPFDDADLKTLKAQWQDSGARTARKSVRPKSVTHVTGTLCNPQVSGPDPPLPNRHPGVVPWPLLARRFWAPLQEQMRGDRRDGFVFEIGPDNDLVVTLFRDCLSAEL